MEIAIAKKTIPKVNNGSLLYVESKINGLVNGRHIGLDVGLYIGNNNKWVSVKKDIVPNDVISFTYDGEKNISLTLKDNTTYTVELNDLKVSFNFLDGATVYTYRVPYNLIFNTIESSGPTYTLTKNTFPYSLGESLNKFDELVIEVNTDGLLVFDGIKL